MMNLKYGAPTKFLLEKKSTLLIIKFNNPKKKNCLNGIAYNELFGILKEAAVDDAVSVVALTGVGDIYTAGNDFSQELGTVDFDEAIVLVGNVIAEFVRFPKLLIAVVNGPCIGIGFTTAALCDIVYCTDTAYFKAPFTKLALCAEGCSSYTFPKIFGKSVASEILLGGKVITAAEALRFGFVSEVVKPKDLDTKIWPTILSYTTLPQQSLRVTKMLMRQGIKEDIEASLKIELNELRKRFASNEFVEAMFAYYNRKAKM